MGVQYSLVVHRQTLIVMLEPIFQGVRPWLTAGRGMWLPEAPHPHEGSRGGGLPCFQPPIRARIGVTAVTTVEGGELHRPRCRGAFTSSRPGEPPSGVKPAEIGQKRSPD